MGAIGRNDPCPCGSGTKYKRCCLGKERTEPVRPPPPTGKDRAALSLALRELIVAMHATIDSVDGRKDLFTCFEALELDTEIVWSRPSGAIHLYAAFGSSPIGRGAARFRANVRRCLTTPDATALLDSLLREPPRAYTLSLDRFGQCATVTPCFGPERESIRVGDVLVFSAKLPSDRVDVVGWVLRLRSYVGFLAVGVLGPKALRRLEERCASLPQADCRAFWDAAAPHLLRAVADPRDEHRAQPKPTPTVRETANELQRAQFAGHVVNRALEAWSQSVVEPIEVVLPSGVRRRLVNARLTAAAAQTEAERRALVEVVHALCAVAHADIARYPYWSRYAKDPALSPETCAARVLETVRLAHDGSVLGIDEEEEGLQPARLLLLPDDHALWRTVHDAAPIKGALAWAAAAGSLGADVRTAADRRLFELRWAALYRQTANRSSWVMEGEYQALLSAFRTHFDPRVLDARLTELELDAGTLRRLLATLAKIAAAPDGGCRVRELPEMLYEFRLAGGFGDTSARNLIDSLYSHVRTWRERLAGVARVTAPPAAKTAAHDDLRQGLDELASLFE